jgi:hypothetical protein
MKLKRFLHSVNLPRVICHHTLGKEHTARHRMLVGVGVMLCGVLIAKSAHHFDFYFIQVVLDLVGYAVHGLGFTPFLEAIIETLE